MAVLTMDSKVETQSVPSGGAERVAVAARAHAILTQTLPDELLDDISTGHASDRTPFKLPAVLAG